MALIERFRAPFVHGLRRRLRSYARQMRGKEPPEITIEEPESLNSCAGRRVLGELLALVLLQAERDGVSRIRLRTSPVGMFYLLDGIDYEMIPPPEDETAVMIRELAAASGAAPGLTGALDVTLAAGPRTLQITLLPDMPPELHITGLQEARR